MNTQVIYTKIPTGLPNPSETFEIKKVAFDPKNVVVPDGHLLVKTLFLSVDPYMRARMRKPEVQSYFPAAQVGKSFMGGAVVEVIRSGDSKFKDGQVLVTFSPWEEYVVIPAVSPMGNIVTIPNPRESKVPLSYYLGVLGMPGLTAYIGLHKFCEPLTPGQTLYVSAAAGAVGQVVGQYAKALGLRVVGSAGSDDKVAFLKEMGFDEAFNYKKHPDFVSILKQTCPKGIDIYFENVGGKMLEAVFEVANDFCRIAVCGMISQYNRTENPEGIHNMFQIISKRIKLSGFIVSDHAAECGSKCIPTFAKFLAEGKMRYRETIAVGIENTPKAFVDMLEGKNFGKAIVKVADL
ncbi:2-alkenal reductase (NADP(+)-dependent) [Folsomia candida]|uniref:15-oxoprostaglandin 13-reductase n=1 Tax=Folsomia candida TaxID=158441 RepID=A0A226EML3_FOLCA|nr:2-alkenal reductase (NADP(+)-dependent) [Folsomia candida]OXA58438.1 2-alkenal reductase (NADP(+)-dependent) [Folsomia candida]